MDLEKLRSELAQEVQMKWVKFLFTSTKILLDDFQNFQVVPLTRFREIYDQSLKELQLTVDELERRSAGIGDESRSCDVTLQSCDVCWQVFVAGNEWKTRYETQVEMNQQLEKQTILLRDKIVDARSTLKDSTTSRVRLLLLTFMTHVKCWFQVKCRDLWSRLKCRKT